MNKFFVIKIFVPISFDQNFEMLNISLTGKLNIFFF